MHDHISTFLFIGNAFSLNPDDPDFITNPKANEVSSMVEETVEVDVYQCTFYSRSFYFVHVLIKLPLALPLP